MADNSKLSAMPLSGCLLLVASPGSVLGPILFIVYINNVDVEFNNLISKFDENTKIGNSVLTNGDRISLQKNLNKTLAWSARWKTPRWKTQFNIGKLKALQIRKKSRYDYEMCSVS